MISVETLYFSVNRILLLAVGLWPYYQSTLVRLQKVVFFSILMSSVVFQLTTFVTAEITLNLIVNVLSSVLCFLSLLVSYSSFLINVQNMKCLMEQLVQICNELKDENEIAIIGKHGFIARHFAIGFTLIVTCIIILLLIEPIWPRLLGIFLFINESRPHCMMPVVTEYFVDQEKYFYLILLHVDVAFGIGLTVIMAATTLFVGCLQCTCGMFRIASYRIEQALTNSMLSNISLESDIMIQRKIAYAIDIHRKAMELIVSFRNNISGLIVPALRVPVVLFLMFLANYIGQKIIDYNNHVYFTAYNIQWYKASTHVQKLILFLLQRGNKSFGLNAGGLVVASLECFASMASASISYFTVIYSMQQ